MTADTTLEEINRREEATRAAAEKKAKGNGGNTSWLAGCLKDGRGKPLPILANAMLALRHDPAVANASPMTRCSVRRC